MSDATTTSTTTATPTPVSLPPAQLKFLGADGTVSLPWRRFFQGVYNRTGGGVDLVAATANGQSESLAGIEADVAQAVADAASAEDQAALGGLLGLLDLEPGRVEGSLSLGDLLAVAGAGDGAGSSAPPKPVAATGGVLPLVNGSVPFLGFLHTPDGQTVGVPLS